MHGRSDLGRCFGAADYEPNVVNIETPDATGVQAVCCSMSPDLVEDPSSLTERGCCLYDDDGDPVLCDCDVLCYLSQPNEEHALHTAVLQTEGDKNRGYYLPPNTLLTLQDVQEPPFTATFKRWRRRSS